MAQKIIKAKIYSLNVKLQSNQRSGDQAYIDLFEKIFAEKIIGTPKRGNSMILRTQFHTKIDGNSVIYGKLARFTKLDSDIWIDLNNLEKSQFDMPANLFPNLKEVDYYFIPKAHRFCIRKVSNTVSLNQVEEFLTDALRKVKFSGEQIDVFIEQSNETIDQILNAPAVKKVDVEISYTNNDIGKEANEYVDGILKEMNANKMKFSVTPDHHNGLSVENKFLRGAIELAKSNGSVIARIINNDQKIERISTRQHPEVLPIEATDSDQLKTSVYRKIMSIFRP